MITEQNLIDAGYVKHPPGPFKEHADALFQKRITDERGTKYFIDIFRYPAHTFPNGTDFPETFEAELYCGGKYTFTINRALILSLVEADCALFWESFWGKYYEYK